MTDLSSLATVWYAFEWLLRITSLFYVPRNRKPTAGMAWLLLILLLPVPGVLVFIVFGSSKLPKSRRDAQRYLTNYVKERLDVFKMKNLKADTSLFDVKVPRKYQATAELAESLSGVSVFGGNTIDVLTDYNSVFERLAADIDGAQHFVCIEFYIVSLDDATKPVFDALERAVKRGVEAYVLYDWYAVRKFKTWKRAKKYLVSIGVMVQASLPPTLPGKGYVRPDLRNHRKLVVIDGVVGYMGSQNMITRGYCRKDDIVYDELMVRVEGPVVLQFESVFAVDWLMEHKQMPANFDDDTQPLPIVLGDIPMQLLPSGPGYVYENNLKIFTQLCYAAKHSITIVNPYFVPEDSLIMALTSAAKRGVKVTLINSATIDQWMVAHAQRSYYEEMLQAGVEIYLYAKPTLLHAKYFMVDDEIALIGSSNMDIRSFELNNELTLICYDRQVARQLAEITKGYLSRSRLLNKKQWLERRRYRQLLDNLARLTSSLQ